MGKQYARMVVLALRNIAFVLLVLYRFVQALHVIRRHRLMSHFRTTNFWSDNLDTEEEEENAMRSLHDHRSQQRRNCAAPATRKNRTWGEENGFMLVTVQSSLIVQNHLYQ